MPTVPRYSESLVQERPLPNVQATAAPDLEFFGGGKSLQNVNKAQQELGRTVQEIGFQEIQKADNAFSQDAFARSLALKNNLFFDPKTGALSKKGKQVVESDFMGDYNKRFEDGLNEIESSMSGRQKRIFAPMRQKLQVELNGQLQRHHFDQANVYQKEAANSNVTALREDAINNWSLPNKLEENLALQEATIKSAHPELSEEGLNNLLLEEKSKTVSGLIQTLANTGFDQVAEQKYKEAIDKKQLTNDDKNKVSRLLEVSTLIGESQRNAANIINQSGGNLEDALEMVDKIRDPKVQDETRRRVKQRYSDIKLSQEENHKNFLDDASKRVYEAKTIDALTPEELDQLSPQEISYMRNLTKPAPVETNYVFLDQLNQLAVEDPKKYMALTPGQVRPYLDDKHLNQFINDRDKVRKGDNTVLQGIRSKQQVLNDVVRGAGLDPNDKDDRKRLTPFYQQIEEQQQLFYNEKKRKPNNQELSNIANGLMTEVVTDRGIFNDTEKMLFEVSPGNVETGERETVDIEDLTYQKIPSSTRNSIIQRFVDENKRVPTEDEVIEIFKTFVRSIGRAN